GGGHELRDVPGDDGRDDPDGLAPHQELPEDAVALLLVGAVPARGTTPGTPESPRDRDRRVPHHHRAERLREDAPGVRRPVLGRDDAGDLLVPYGDRVLDPGDHRD